MATPTLSIPEDGIAVESPSDVDQLLQEMFDLKRELIQRESDIEQETKPLRDQIDALKDKVEKIKSQHEDYIQRRKDALEAREDAILDYAEEHQTDLLGGTDGKTHETPFGSVSYKQKPFNFEWVDKDLAIESLKKLGHKSMVVKKETAYKGTLKKHPELLRKLDGVEVVEAHDVASVELTIG